MGSKERVLGVQWDPGPDMLEFEIHWPLQPTPITKRVMLSVIMRVFDPLGLLTPVTVRLKMMMRKAWSCDPYGASSINHWHSWDTLVAAGVLLNFAG